MEKITQSPIQRVDIPKPDPHRQSTRKTLKANDTLVSKQEETKQEEVIRPRFDPKKSPNPHKPKVEEKDPMQMSVGSNLLQMLQNNNLGV